MARTANKLTVKGIGSLTKPGRHSDGNGLYLKIAPGGSKSWVFMATNEGQKREVGLGSIKDITLAQARVLAGEARQRLKNGIDPRLSAATPAGIPTFGEIADRYIERMSPSWRNSKHRDQWKSTLSRVRDKAGKISGHCQSIINLPVSKIDTKAVLGVLEPIWADIPDTASKLRQRIEAVLNAATVGGHRSGPNPAAWKGHLALILPALPTLSRGHHEAMPYKDVPAFIRKLHVLKGTGVFALEFTILTAARSGEVRKAKWVEIDLEKKLWTVPAERMKAKREHTVPLSPRALAILDVVSELRNQHDFLFPGSKAGTAQSDMTLLKALKRNDENDYTVHGFRSSFRDWVGDETDFPGELAEAALAHTLGKVEGAYRRATAVEKRRELMDAWEAFCLGKPFKSATAS